MAPRPLHALIALSLGSVLACGLGCAPEDSECGFGERQGPLGCERVDHLQINFDERLDDRGDTSRRGIGVNACTFRASTLQEVAGTEACSAYRFGGTSSAESYPGDAGGLLANLGDPVFMLPAAEGGCYDTDLHPNRDDLFTAGETFVIEGSGGRDFPAFSAELNAPETLALDTPERLDVSGPLSLEWVASDADHLVILISSYDEGADRTTNVLCFADDTGAAEVPAELLAELEPEAAIADLYFLRQRWIHIEPEGEDVAIDVVATSSVTRRVPIDR